MPAGPPLHEKGFPPIGQEQQHGNDQDHRQQQTKTGQADQDIQYSFTIITIQGSAILAGHGIR